MALPFLFAPSSLDNVERPSLIPTLQLSLRRAQVVGATFIDANLERALIDTSTATTHY